MGRKWLCVIAALFSLVTCAYAADEILVAQTEARSMLDALSAFRTGEQAYYWNESDTELVSSKGEPLTYSYALEETAMQRAADVALPMAVVQSASAPNYEFGVLKAQKLAPGTTFDPATAEVSGSAEPGDVVVLTIGLKNGGAAMNINTFSVSLSYDNAKVSPYASFAEKPYQPPTELASWMMAGNDGGADFKISAMSMTPYGIPSGAETPLVYLAFSVNADATEGAAAFDMGATGNAVTASGGAGYELDLKGYVLTIDAAPAFAISAAAPDKANGTLSVTLANSSAATVAVSYFDANGKFVSAQLQTVAANAGTATLALSADANRARVILLDADCRPLCAWLDATI